MVGEYDLVYQAIDDGWEMTTVHGLRGAVTPTRTMAEARRTLREVIETLLDLVREQTSDGATNAPM